MSVRDSRRRMLVEWCVIAIAVVAIGLVHRRASPDPLADDRLLSPEPSWFQLAAPLWHAAIDRSASPAYRLTSALDPLTAASAAGDTRAVAAIAAMLAALLLIGALRAARVPLAIALLLAAATAGSLLPVATALTASHAIQMLNGGAMIWLIARSPASHAQRLAVLAVLTIVGSMVHASFAAFAAVIWVSTCCAGPDARRWDTAAAAVLTLAVALLAAAWPLDAVVRAASPEIVQRPGFVAIVAGLVTGRFPDALQPLRQSGLLQIVTLAVAGPAIVSLPLALAGLIRRDLRPFAIATAAAAVAVCLFQAGSWLPDPSVAVAPARIAVLVLAGLGLSWIIAQPVRGATAVAVVASLVIASSGWLSPSRWNAIAYAERLRVFVSAAAAAPRETVWAVDSLATARALMLGDRRLAAGQVSLQPDMLQTIPAEQRLLVYANRTTRVPRLRASESRGLRYQSAADFLAAQPEWSWVAVAARDVDPSGFCGDLLTHLHTAVDAPTRVAVLARVGDVKTGTLSAPDRLEVAFGARAGSLRHDVPAQFAIETAPALRVAVNDRTIATATAGMVVVVFDPWARASDHWVLASCGDAPPIHDAQLHQAYWIDGDSAVAIPDTPVLDTSVIDVPLGFDGQAWFADGWHDPESDDGHPFRWTGSREAHVNVLVSHRQPIRVRVTGGLVATADHPNAMTLVWNGTALGPLGAWKEEWMVPAAQVRRGQNMLTIRVLALISPAGAAGSGDTRMLGARIMGLTLAPGP